MIGCAANPPRGAEAPTGVDDQPPKDPPKERDSTRYLTMGASIGLLGALGAVAGAAVCPVCVVATPALLGVGLYKRWKERQPDLTQNDDGSVAPKTG